jgi:hypothetical protein
MELTPAQVKNLMRRGLRRLVDPEPEPKDKERIWAYFEGRCAYCDTVIAEGGGDIDHLVSAALGGANSLANRVLACKPCNAQEKRDQDWESFINSKCPGSDIRARRTQRIRSWIESHGGHPVLRQEVLSLLTSEAKRVTDEYDLACRRIRSLLASD